ncbi:tRNA-specific adenosine deaminase 1 [Mortierella sp. AD094]|nr:tRNA-specific adenosine deaminase 1 [Mortierella sp. AD094]
MPHYTSQELIQGIVKECHAQFCRLPKHGKPAKKSNGQAEWTILAGIVMVTPTDLPSAQHPGGSTDNSSESTDGDGKSWQVECISLATGSKCLPQGKLSPRGDLLNDCHAEVLARRGFNRWCLMEMQSCISHFDNTKNRFRHIGDHDAVSSGDKPLFELVDPRTQFHLYVSQAPCGDATTGSLAQIQTLESKNAFLSGQQTQILKAEASPQGSGNDKSPGQVSEAVDLKRQRESEGYNAVDSPAPKQPKLELPVDDSQGCDHALGLRRGRIDYDSVGVLRTKPGRVDSEPTMSMSCSDKIARWNVLGLTSALVAPFLSKPIYLQSIITRELFDSSALERALYKRIQHRCSCKNPLAASKVSEPSESPYEESPYQPHRIEIYESSEAFEFSKEVVTAKSDQDDNPKSPIACSSSISWIASEPSTAEVLINGCKAGASAKQPIQPKSRSRLCKINMYKTSIALWRSLSTSVLGNPYTQKLVQRMIGLGTAEERALNADKITYGEWKALAKDHNSAKEHLFQGVFRNWVRGDMSLEMFDVNDNS